MSEPGPRASSAEQSYPTTTVEDTTAPATTAEESEPRAGQASDSGGGVSREGTPPPLPPRPRNLSLLSDGAITPTKLSPGAAARPTLQSKATTALTLPDVQTHSDGRKGTHSTPGSRRISFSNLRAGISRSGSEADDSGSVRSYGGPMLEAGEDMESVLEDIVTNQERTVWTQLLSPRQQQEHILFPIDEEFERAFDREFDELEDVEADGSNEGK